MTRRIRPANRRPGPRMAELVAERDAAVKREGETSVRLLRAEDRAKSWEQFANDAAALAEKFRGQRDAALVTVEAQRKALAEYLRTNEDLLNSLCDAAKKAADNDAKRCRTCAKLDRCSLTRLGSGPDWTCGYWAATT